MKARELKSKEKLICNEHRLEGCPLKMEKGATR